MFHGLSSPSSPKHGRGAQASDSATKKAESEAAQNSPKQGTPAQVLTRESALPATSVLHLGAEPMHSSFVSGPSLHGHISREAKPILPDEIQAARTKEPAQSRIFPILPMSARFCCHQKLGFGSSPAAKKTGSWPWTCRNC